VRDRRDVQEVTAVVDSELDLYEIAYLCGGPERVAMAALVALHEEGRIQISAGRHRVSVLDRQSDDPIQAATLDAVPDTGKVLGAVVQAITSSSEVLKLIEVLKSKKLAARHRLPGGSPLTGQGRRRRQQLTTAEIPAEHRISILGAAGIEDPKLRRTFESPDPPAGRTLIPKDPHRSRMEQNENSPTYRSTEYGGAAGMDGGGSGY
jgi:hypothetical protein